MRRDIRVGPDSADRVRTAGRREAGLVSDVADGRHSCGMADPPCSRGEYASVATTQRYLAGSSPLSRGIHRGPLSDHSFLGIIPALAGNTHCRVSCPATAPDHPRSRGEYAHWMVCPGRYRGSSPLSRGIPRSSAAIRSRDGIIPALAGNTCIATSTKSVIRDHPRSRGEYGGMYRFSMMLHGSSPLSRGIHPRDLPTSQGRRIIPALAGNTPKASHSHSAR